MGGSILPLTEDRALTADAVAQGYQITYNDEAMFYDEQPTSLKIALRQDLDGQKVIYLPSVKVVLIYFKYFLW